MAKKKKAVGAAVGAKAAKRAARGAGKMALKGGMRAATPRDPATTRYLRYGFFALVGFVVGALIARSGNREDASTFTGTTGAAGGATSPVSDPTRPESPQRPEDPNRTGTGREYSDPSAGPLIGRSHRGRIGDIPEQQEEVENRIRTRVGEDPRTADVPHLNVEVNDGVADIRGEVHSYEEKGVVEEIAADVDGVTEVRNLLTVNPDAPRRRS
jgi:BON domain